MQLCDILYLKKYKIYGHVMDMLTVNYPYTFKQACLISSIDLTVGQSFIFLQLLSIWQFEGEVLKIAQMFSFSIQNVFFWLCLKHLWWTSRGWISQFEVLCFRYFFS